MSDDDVTLSHRVDMFDDGDYGASALRLLARASDAGWRKLSRGDRRRELFDVFVCSDCVREIGTLGPLRAAGRPIAHDGDELVDASTGPLPLGLDQGEIVPTDCMCERIVNFDGRCAFGRTHNPACPVHGERTPKAAG